MCPSLPLHLSTYPNVMRLPFATSELHYLQCCEIDQNRDRHMTSDSATQSVVEGHHGWMIGSLCDDVQRKRIDRFDLYKGDGRQWHIQISEPMLHSCACAAALFPVEGAACALLSIGIASAAPAIAGDGWISTGISVRMLVAKGE